MLPKKEKVKRVSNKAKAGELEINENQIKNKVRRQYMNKERKQNSKRNYNKDKKVMKANEEIRESHWDE